MSRETHPSDFGCDVDVVVVGAGIAGLIAARDCAANGLKVSVYEARERLGGRVWTEKIGDAFAQSAASFHANNGTSGPTDENLVHMTTEMSTGCIDMGAEWFDLENQRGVVDEAAKYGLEFETPDYRCCWSFVLGKKLGLNDDPIPNPLDKVEFERVLDLMHDDMERYRTDQDERRIKGLDGYDLAKFDIFDVPFVDYVEKRLQATGPAKDFLFAQGFTLMGADHHQYSALGVLHDLCNLAGRVANIRHAFMKPLSRIKGGSCKLVEALERDLKENYGVNIISGMSIASITSFQPPPDLDAPAWRNDLRHPNPVVHVIAADGSMIKTRGVVVAIPMNVLPIVYFSPSLPPNLSYVSTRCNAGRCSKSWVLASGVSKSIDQVICWPGCVESYVKYRFNVPDAVISTSPTLIRSRTVGRAVSPVRTAAPSAMVPTALSYKEVCVIATFGLKEDVLGDVASALVGSEGGKAKVVDREAEEAIQCRRMNRALRKHHPTIKVMSVVAHDYYGDMWARGTWFACRAGTRSQHAEACLLALKPWDHARTLYIAGSDYSPGWCGWVEGAISSGKEVSHKMNKYLKPPPEIKNFVKPLSSSESMRTPRK